LAVGAIIDPFAGCRHPLAGRDGRSVSDHCDKLPMPTRLDLEHAEAVFLVVVGHALDEAGQHFLN
jgi:hypothetical protein